MKPPSLALLQTKNVSLLRYLPVSARQGRSLDRYTPQTQDYSTNPTYPKVPFAWFCSGPVPWFPLALLIEILPGPDPECPLELVLGNFAGLLLRLSLELLVMVLNQPFWDSWWSPSWELCP